MGRAKHAEASCGAVAEPLPWKLGPTRMNACAEGNRENIPGFTVRLRTPLANARRRFDRKSRPTDPQCFRTGGLHTPSVFVAFDLLHSDGQHLTYSPLIERKQVRTILPKNSQSMLFCDHIEVG